MSSPSKRREMDLMKLMMSDYKVEMINDGMQEFYLHFSGPNDSPYHGGVWRIRVELPDGYPYKSPSICFINKIYHPNVDEIPGKCFRSIPSAVLLYPNPSDALNGEAAVLMMRDQGAYEQRVKEDIGAVPEEKFSDEEMSEEEYDSSDDAVAGQPDP
ncbi:hypothetical protein CRYUN_Cryun20dG0027100 [Craigia yunnanensis]